ncbi:MAG: right-handed parallel beta-helix repeat-containing protein [Phycisphaerales bacterium]|nr:right-handed parallel beta-helix repeat-containing protein [Phycisphaerales bacterium]
MTNARSLPALGVLLAASAALSDTVVVTTGFDDIDIDWQTATIADLPGPDGKVSFSEAMIATNNTPGHDRIEFAIPQSEWQLQFLFPGRAVVKAINTFFWRANDPVTIDGTTQTAFTGDTNPDGWEVAFFGGGVFVNGDDSEVTGIDSLPLDVTGDNALIHGMSGTTNITLYDSHGSMVRDNFGTTIKIDRSNDVTVIGNTVRRVRVQGFVSEFGTGPVLNTRIGGPTLAERNYITGYGTHNGEGYPGGTTVELFDTTGTIVENNWIGTTPDGMSSGSNASTQGIGFSGENHDVLIKDNRIAGILGIGMGPHAAGFLFGYGILVGGTGSGVVITGNTIGLNALGEPVLGSVTGIEVSDYFAGPMQDVTIGGTNAGQGNEIAGHLFNGVTIEPSVSGVLIAGNSIHTNGELGIELLNTGFNYGVTPNDPLDTDIGGNGLQNYPVLTGADAAGASVHIFGSLDSTPNRVFAIEFFANTECNPTGFGEGERLLGRVDVMTNGGGIADIDATIMSPVSGSEWITATATDRTTNNTSEFSACVGVTGSGACLGDASGNAVVDVDDLNMILGAWGTEVGAGSPLDLAGADGWVDVDDLNMVLAHWGTACP